MEDATSAKAEADSREKRTQEFTQQMKKKSFSRATESVKRIINQRKKAKKLKQKQLAARRSAAEQSAQTSQNLKTAVKTASKVGKGVVQRVKGLVSKENNP